MIIKKYFGKNEMEAIMLAREELGKDAIVTNVKKITPKGIFRIFGRPRVEITAAVDHPDPTLAIEEKIRNIQKLLEKQVEEKVEEKVEESNVKESNVKEQSLTDSKNLYSQTIYKQLIKKEVEEEYAKQILDEVQIKEDSSLDRALSLVYQKIVLKLGQAKGIEIEKNKNKFIFFIGPTGVGKTTTIAKIASHLSLYEGAKVALLTLDTYRIAAVEQLKTYANILGLPFNVIYTVEEIKEKKAEYDSYDIILVDTAGMSHKNKEKQEEVEGFIESIKENQRETYLVLSITTKYKDLKKIVNQYSKMTRFSILFTKLDETSNLGCILNLKMLTKASLSYITFGQMVPDDISLLNTQSIAKQLLGGIE